MGTCQLPRVLSPGASVRLNLKAPYKRLGLLSGTEAGLHARQKIAGAEVWMGEALEFIRASGHGIIGEKEVGKK